LRPMFWAVTLSSASNIFRAKGIPLMRGDIAKVTCPSTQVNDQTGGYLVTSGQRLPRLGKGCSGNRRACEYPAWECLKRRFGSDL